MLELIFIINRISYNDDPNKGWELQFKFIGDSQLIEPSFLKGNFICKIGSEEWEVSASKSEKQNQFNSNSFLWYIKGSILDTNSNKKYKNLTKNVMGYSYDFIGSLTLKYKIETQKEYRGCFHIKDNKMILVL